MDSATSAIVEMQIAMWKELGVCGTNSKQNC
ncbi:unnamed protein product [Notodromas monacha]|uniref:Uncharacterized protein n=1 Tax=Notodromas monacha TaxID=399045 RepID=A0A7R9C4B7_9CRUS|nr:unnamed protein product [Notodromas monacha]CAG0926021.1 unnamed protein product [Notodromas monacha]